MPQLRSTFGCTMPQPRISNQSSPSFRVSLPPERSQRMSISAEGSVKGKWCGRKRACTASSSKKRAMKAASVVFRWPMWMSRSITRPSIWWNIGVWVASLSLRKVRPGAMMRIGGFCDIMVDLHRAGVGAQHLALARFRVGLQEEGVVHLPRRMLGREVQGREVVEVVLDVRPLGDREAHVGEDGDHLVHDLHGRVHPALAARAAGQGQVG